MKNKLKIFLYSISLWSIGFVAKAINTDSVDSGGDLGVDLTIQSVFGVITGLACWFTRFALILMVVMIVFYGIKFMTAQGNPTKLGEAKESLKWAIVGVFVILGTYTIIATVANAVGADFTLIMPLDCSGFQ